MCRSRGLLFVCFVSFAFSFTEARCNALPPRPIALPVDAPALADFPQHSHTTDSRFDFALRSLQWIHAQADNRDNPALKSDPRAGFSPAQWQMIEVINILQSIPDSQADKEAHEQREQRQNVVWAAIKKGIENLSVKSAEDVIKDAVLDPAVVGDGQGPLRDGMIGQAYTALFDAGAKVGGGTNIGRDDFIKQMTDRYEKSKISQDKLNDATKSRVTTAEFERALYEAERYREHMRQYQQGIQDARKQGVAEQQRQHFTPVTGPVAPFCRSCGPGHETHYDLPPGHNIGSTGNEYPPKTPPVPPPPAPSHTEPPSSSSPAEPPAIHRL